MRNIFLGLFLLMLYGLPGSAMANCFGPDGCQIVVCRDSKFVNDIETGGIRCLWCGAGGGTQITSAISGPISCIACSGNCHNGFISGTEPTKFEIEALSSADLTREAGIDYSLIFSSNLAELRPVWNAPEILSTLLMMEGQAGQRPRERPAYQQLMISESRMETFLSNRIEQGITYSQLEASGGQTRDNGMTVEYMVEFTVVQLDRTTLQIELESLDISPQANFRELHSATVIVSNEGRARHDYEVVEIVLGHSDPVSENKR